MSATAPGSLILIGPPGAGCSSVARAIGSAQGLPVLDLGQLVADELGTRPELALVAVAETEYRRIEAGNGKKEVYSYIGNIFFVFCRHTLFFYHSAGNKISIQYSIPDLRTRNGADSSKKHTDAYIFSTINCEYRINIFLCQSICL